MFSSRTAANENTEMVAPHLGSDEPCPRCRAARVSEAIFCHVCGFRFPLSPERQQIVRTISHACRVCGNIDTLTLGPVPEPDSAAAERAQSGADPLTFTEGPQAPNLSKWLPQVPDAPRFVTAAVIMASALGALSVVALAVWFLCLTAVKIRENTVNVAWFCFVTIACSTLLAFLNARREHEDIAAKYEAGMDRYLRARKTWLELVYCPRCEFVSNCRTGETGKADTMGHLFM